MQPGIHVVERARVPALAASGLSVPDPWMGVLDALRMVEGHLPEPPAAQPLGLVGLDALLAAVPGPGTTVLQAVRAGLVEARRYFAWKQIPVVLLLDGRLDDPGDGDGLRFWQGERCWALAPLLGTRFVPAKPGTNGWWSAPQIG